MASRLKNAHHVWALARDLGIKRLDDPVGGILGFCEKRIKNFLKDYPDCKTLSEFLGWIACRLKTSFEIITCDQDLQKIRYKYIKMGEKIFSRLAEELSGDVYGITFRLQNRKPWENEFVSVIDCRGPKKFRAYYTKWHEVSHLLVLTDQLRFQFRRTHCPTIQQDPEEALIDVIAGNFGFYPQIVHKYAKGKISFEAIESLRLKLCPEASQQASLIGFTKAWPKPCLLLHCEKALKKGQRNNIEQQRMGFLDTPTPVLRAVHVTGNNEARDIGLQIFKNMRVPENSVISRIFVDDIFEGEAEEDLSQWQTSDGMKLPQYPILVKAKISCDSVDALIIPLR